MKTMYCKEASTEQNANIMVKEPDATEYLSSSPANREHLDRAIENVKQGKVITFETLNQAIKRAEQLAASE
ncbi:MAG: hypothetical protein LBC80_00730 [Treponema sp.]|jgi:hypothetical protein|nr:hypothetical protein [Treponema sp.]